MKRILFSTLAGLAVAMCSGGSAVEAGWRHHGYGHGYYADQNSAPGAGTIAYYGHGYWYRTPYYSHGILSDYYGGYRPSHSYGIYNQQQYGNSCPPNQTAVPYDFAPYATKAPTSIAPSPTGYTPVSQ